MSFSFYYYKFNYKTKIFMDEVFSLFIVYFCILCINNICTSYLRR
jgi:hypothetical protein